MIKENTEEGKKGWLEKRSGGYTDGRRMSIMQSLGAGWQERYFVLLPQGTELSYYTSQDAFEGFEKPHGTLDLQAASPRPPRHARMRRASTPSIRLASRRGAPQRVEQRSCPDTGRQRRLDRVQGEPA